MKMNSVYILGDSHLGRCYDQAKMDNKSLNFDSEINCKWEVDLQQIKTVEVRYKALLSQNGIPKAVVLMCGGYDLTLQENPHNISALMKKFTQHILSSGVKQIIVCSIIDRYGYEENSEEDRLATATNNILFKQFKKNHRIYFTNIRPQGRPNDFLDDDHYHLKCEGYRQIYERIKTALTKRVFITLDQVESSTALSKDSSATEMKDASYTKDLPVEKRMDEFKDVLLKDFHRLCTEEKQLSEQLSAIQTKLSDITQQKTQVVSIYEKLFNCQPV